jgi:hypothetical protein
MQPYLLIDRNPSNRIHIPGTGTCPTYPSTPPYMLRPLPFPAPFNGQPLGPM